MRAFACVRACTLAVEADEVNVLVVVQQSAEHAYVSRSLLSIIGLFCRVYRALLACIPERHNRHRHVVDG